MINIYSLINEARKSGNKTRLSVYQALLSELQKYETSKGAEALTEEKQLEIFNKYAKSLDDGLTQFIRANREDLIAQYSAELAIVKELLPAPATPQQILEFIQTDEFFNQYKQWTLDHVHVIAIPKKDMGASIKYVKSKFPTAEGKDISNIIKAMII